MKKLLAALLLLLLAGLCACGQAAPEDIAPYASTLKKYYRFRTVSKYFYEDSIQYYTLYDIDGDGTKELLLGAENQGQLVGLVNLYAVQDGKAALQRPAGEGTSCKINCPNE